MDNSGLAVVFAFLAALGFASGNILIRVGTQRVSAPTATFFTVLTGAILVVGLAFAFNLSDIKALPPGAYGWFALMGAMAYLVARVFNNMAITMIGAARAVPMTSLQPAFAFGLGVAFLGERPGLLVSLGMPMIVCGLILVFLAESGAGPREGRILTARTLGYLLAVGAAASFASRDVISRHVVSGIAPPLVAAGFALAIGGGMLLAVVHRDVAHSLRHLPGRYIIICGLAGVCQGLAVASLFQALSRAPVTVVSPINASNPLITLVLAHLFLRRLESINLLLVIGTLLSVGGVALVVLGAAT
jgi:drug/metabolite transporter (DMT)-like permease